LGPEPAGFFCQTTIDDAVQLQRSFHPQTSVRFFVSFKKILLWLVLVNVAAVAILPTLWLSSGLPTVFIDWGLPLLSIERPLAKADAILVLGGESEARPIAGARLYQQGIAPLLFVIGEGDHAESVRLLRERGVPAERIKVEPKSSSTLENALFSRPLLEAAGVGAPRGAAFWVVDEEGAIPDAQTQPLFLAAGREAAAAATVPRTRKSRGRHRAV
jgi:hypothetical protein